ncbi:2-dehydropantoate 2-reductase N-terminal domain-containing protein [Nocardia sp. CDC153]|uniref:ketopantoate reductase family protein n=1 Tax=Nocardia sp. CDC153 TaxID=3112167 RepID=UPI002DB744A1|nr:2-dehydropantoate 2-reductase N-terminal domain-containing protein [Nocardia sp. CDC153]MEC3952646.1 2-dehydropantoate 2-reductase N-terminal domain-containing protein [Nocardia sp. CDC153]
MRRPRSGPGERILVAGAGVIGRVYAARLAAAGNEIEVLARGATLRELAERPITLRSGGRSLRQPVAVVDVPEGGYDTVLLAVRRDQIDSAAGCLEAVDCDRVVTLGNCPLGVAELRARLGDRVIAGFPGVGGRFDADGVVEYVPIRQQPTTLERRGGRESGAVMALRRSGFEVRTSGRMQDWLATHAVFVVAMCEALDRVDYSAPGLADDPAVLSALVDAVRSGFRGLRARGTVVTPAALAFLFTRTPTGFAAAYWSRLLRGPVGTVALAPHARAARDTEIAALRADVARLLPLGSAPGLDSFLRVGASDPGSGPPRP